MGWDHGRPYPWDKPTAKLGDLGGQAVGNCRLLNLFPPKWLRSSCFEQRAMSGGVQLCINTEFVSYHFEWRAGKTDCSNNGVYLWLVTMYVTLPFKQNQCTTAISVTRESLACNFLRLDFLNPPTCIRTAISCKDASRPWFTTIPSDLYQTLKKV